jgi:hypothetical protein
MISFIICSTKKELNSVLKDNMASTVKVPFEIVLIDNSLNTYSIFSAYEEGVKRANYPYLCFIHEDILFRSDNVGECIVNSFEKNPDLGVLGVVGIQMLPQYPFGWWAAGYDYYVGNIISNDKKAKMVNYYQSGCPTKTVLEDAVACDGLFLCIRKDLFSEIRWDTENFHGFHCYDMDICMQVVQAGKKVMVAKDLKVEHFSTGNPAESFTEGCVLFSKKWNWMLPVYVNSVSKTDAIKIQDRCMIGYLRAFPLAIRYKHIQNHPIGNRILSLMKLLKRF